VLDQGSKLGEQVAPAKGQAAAAVLLLSWVGELCSHATQLRSALAALVLLLWALAAPLGLFEPP
jgi:hypothetical protein